MDIDFNKNEDHNKLLLSNLKQRVSEIKLGGGQKNIDKQHKKGKLTARERIKFLLDSKKPCIEIGLFLLEKTCTMSMEDVHLEGL